MSVVSLSPYMKAVARDESKQMQCLVESFLEKKDNLKIVDEDVTYLWGGFEELINKSLAKAMK